MCLYCCWCCSSDTGSSIASSGELSSADFNYTSLATRLFVSTLYTTENTRALESRNKAALGVSSYYLTSYVGVIVVLSILVVGGLLFTMCRLLLKAAVHGETTARCDGSFLYAADRSPIAVRIGIYDDDCSE